MNAMIDRPKSAWVTLAQAARAMGMTPKGAKGRLAKLEKSTGETILRRVGTRWEVSGTALDRALNEPEVEPLSEVHDRLRVVEERVEALRTVGAKFRRQTRETLEKHRAAIKIIAEANKAAVDALEVVKSL